VITTKLDKPVDQLLPHFPEPVETGRRAHDDSARQPQGLASALDQAVVLHGLMWALR
jgi:hypothetical protein